MILTHHGMNSIVRSIAQVGPVVNIGGRDYTYVQIGNQLWLAENLDWKFTGLNFRDSVNNPMDNTFVEQAAYYNYDENTYGVNGNKNGLLYNWESASYLNLYLNALGVPDGWRIPSKEDWETLVDAIGSENAGSKLKTTSGWETSNGTDEYGFHGSPCGCWQNGFSALGTCNYFWTSDSNTTYGMCYYLYDGGSIVYHGYQSHSNGYSIRLVKDIS